MTEQNSIYFFLFLINYSPSRTINTKMKKWKKIKKRFKTGAIPTPRNLLIKTQPFIPPLTTVEHENFLHFPKKLSMWLNDEYGCCVTSEQAFAKGCGENPVYITDDTLMNFLNRYGGKNGWYIHYRMMELAHADFHPKAQFYQDNKYYYNGEKVYGVDWTDPNTLKQAIIQGPVATGVLADQLQNVVSWSNGWVATGFEEDNRITDHVVSTCGFGSFSWLAEQLGTKLPSHIDGTTQGYAIFTWGTIGLIDHASFLAITIRGEAWLRVPITRIDEL